MSKKPKSADKNAKPLTKAEKVAKATKIAADKAQAGADAKAAKEGKMADAAAKAKDGKPPKGAVVARTELEDKMLFLHHLPKVKAQRDVIAKATNLIRTLYQAAKVDGFDKADFDLGIQLETAEQEAVIKSKVVRQMTIAKYMGCDLGAQLDMFLEPVRMPAADRAYIEGQNASMQHKAARPEYDPSTEQHREYMRGYHEVQEKQLTKGIAPTEPVPSGPLSSETATLITKAEKVAKASKGDDADVKTVKPTSIPHKPPSSGMAMTRADFEAQKKKQQAEAEAAFKKPEVAAAGDTGSMFHKKAASPAS